MSQQNGILSEGQPIGSEDGARFRAVCLADRGLLLRFRRIVGEYRLVDIGLIPSPPHSDVGGEYRLVDIDLDVDLWRRPTAIQRTCPGRHPTVRGRSSASVTSFTATQNSNGQTYLDLFAASLEESTGRTVAVSDLSDDAATTARVADRLRTGEVTRGTVAAADIVLVSVGGNDSDPFGVYPDGTCTPTQSASDCLNVYSPTFAANYEAILSEIEDLRDGQPTAIRVTSADNPFVGWSEAPSATFGVDFYAEVAAAQTQAACGAATAHGGLCVDYLHIFGGPDGTADPAPFLGPGSRPPRRPRHPGDRRRTGPTRRSGVGLSPARRTTRALHAVSTRSSGNE